MRGEESRLSENNQGIEKVKQQHYIQEDKVCFSDAIMGDPDLVYDLCDMIQIMLHVYWQLAFRTVFQAFLDIAY